MRVNRGPGEHPRSFTRYDGSRTRRLPPGGRFKLRRRPRTEDQLPWRSHGTTVIHPGVGEGRTIGGNLSLLAALMGTRWEPDFTGRLVLIEEVREAPYRVNRMLTQDAARLTILEGALCTEPTR